MANVPPWLAQASGQGNSSGPSKGAITRRMKKKKNYPDAKTDAAEKKNGGPSKSDPDYKEDMTGN